MPDSVVGMVSVPSVSDGSARDDEVYGECEYAAADRERVGERERERERERDGERRTRKAWRAENWWIAVWANTSPAVSTPTNATTYTHANMGCRDVGHQVYIESCELVILHAIGALPNKVCLTWLVCGQVRQVSDHSTPLPSLTRSSSREEKGCAVPARASY
jgi:hypothetical protein